MIQIIFHNCLNNVLEYISDRDSGRLMRNLCRYDLTGKLPDDFWCHIYNIGGGEKCRVSTSEMFQVLYSKLGFTNLDYIIKPKWFALRNFHGQYYLDSDKLENYLHFRQDGIDYFYTAYLVNLGKSLHITKMINKTTLGQKIMGSIVQHKLKKLARRERGTLYFIEQGLEDYIETFWGGKHEWDKIPGKFSEFDCFSDWDTVVWIDHGYDEQKEENKLELYDLISAAEFRGGKCLAKEMEVGDWSTKLPFRCAFGHEFKASPRLVLEGGHWCPVCERDSWNYYERAKVEPFLAQVLNPLHLPSKTKRYKKLATELDVI